MIPSHLEWVTNHVEIARYLSDNKVKAAFLTGLAYRDLKSPFTAPPECNFKDILEILETVKFPDKPRY